MKKISLIIFTIMSCFTINAQLYKHHDWDEEATYKKIAKDDKKLSSFAIKEKYLIQYYAPFLGNGTIKLFETKHSIIQINNEKGIDQQNRVYIPIRNVRRVIDIKARVIQSDGTIKILDKSTIKELENVKDYGNFKIFAFQGVTANSQLEFIYTLERNPSTLGFVIVQKKYKVNEAEVIIRKPFSLSYRIQEYNSFPKMQTEKVEGNKQALTATINNIEAMSDEAMASPEASRMKVAYQVSAGYMSNRDRWNNLTTNIKKNYLGQKPKKFKALISDYTKYVSDKPRENNTHIINNICEYVHANYNIIKEYDEKLSNLQYIITKKKATESGITKVFSCLFNHENLYYEFVLTSDRFNHKFDPDFFSNLNLQTALFYFEDENMYIDPSNVNSRLNFAPTSAIANNAIFINSSARRFKTIETPKASENVIKRDFNININTESLLPTVACEHELTGYRGTYLRRSHKYYKNKDLNLFKNFSAVRGIDDAKFLNFNVENEDLKLVSNNIPLKLNYSYTTESLIEELNEDFILNFGKVIGTQSEFYQEEKRVNPVELFSLITYKYKIAIHIPKGFTPKGLDAIKMNKVLHINNELACSFISEVETVNNTVVINVTEIYNKLFMDLKYYDAYKDVVNAAFDFSNKGVLFKKQI